MHTRGKPLSIVDVLRIELAARRLPSTEGRFRSPGSELLSFKGLVDFFDVVLEGRLELLWRSLPLPIHDPCVAHRVASVVAVPNAPDGHGHGWGGRQPHGALQLGRDQVLASRMPRVEGPAFISRCACSAVCIRVQRLYPRVYLQAVLRIQSTFYAFRFRVEDVVQRVVVVQVRVAVPLLESVPAIIVSCG